MKVVRAGFGDKKNHKILMFGQASYLNKGCEALITTTGTNVKKANKQNTITLATFDFNNDKKYFDNIIGKYVPHNSNVDQVKLEEYQKDGKNIEQLLQKDVLESIPKADLCISIGGDNYCYPGQINFLSTIDEAAKAEGKKLVLYGASIDEDVLTEEFVADIRKFDVILVRESLSFNLLAPFVDEHKLLLAPDPAFSLGTDSITLPAVFNNKEGVVGLNLSPLILKYQGDGVDVFAALTTLVGHILKTYPYGVALIPHVYVKENNDLDILEKLYTQYKGDARVAILNKRIYGATELKFIISKCRFLVAARTHASIAGYSSLIPTLVLGYSTKSKGIAKDIFGDYTDYVLPVQGLFGAEKLIKNFDFLVKYEPKIRNVLSKKMPTYIKEAGELFEKVIDTIDQLDQTNVTKVEKCSGCSACASSCPETAITMKPDNEGFLFPIINQDMCIDCGQCRRVCPNNNKYNYNYDKISVLAARNNNDEERNLSSSGGIFGLLAKKILDEGGCVFGAAYTKENDVTHIKIEKEEELELLRGSKYVESTIGNSFMLAKKELMGGRKVLFSGTPCQIEGLRGYLGRDYDSLVCISVFCHGVPSKKVFRNHLDEVEAEYGNKVVSLSFRNKENGWKNFMLAYNLGNKVIKKNMFDDPYMAGFLQNYYLRQSCYDCEYKLGKKNTSDIILGDLWGVEVFDKPIDDDKGLSAVVINSKKGNELINNIKNEMFSKKIRIDDVTKYNPGLVKINPINLHRFRFFDIFNKMGTRFAVDYFFKIDTIKKLKIDLDLNTELVAEKDGQIGNFQNEIATKEKIIKEILNSKRWKFMERLISIVYLPRKLTTEKYIDKNSIDKREVYDKKN